METFFVSIFGFGIFLAGLFYSGETYRIVRSRSHLFLFLQFAYLCVWRVVLFVAEMYHEMNPNAFSEFVIEHRSLLVAPTWILLSFACYLMYREVSKFNLDRHGTE